MKQRSVLVGLVAGVLFLITPLIYLPALSVIMLPALLFNAVVGFAGSGWISTTVYLLVGAVELVSVPALAAYGWEWLVEARRVQPAVGALLLCTVYSIFVLFAYTVF